MPLHAKLKKYKKPVQVAVCGECEHRLTVHPIDVTKVTCENAYCPQHMIKHHAMTLIVADALPVRA